MPAHREGPCDDAIEYLGFTVDGVALNDLSSDANNVTALGGMDEDFARENIRRMLGERVPMPDFEPRWFKVQSPRGRPFIVPGLTTRSGRALRRNG